MEDFDPNELFEENNEIETIKKDAQMEDALYALKLKLANENYEMIVENGIDIKSMRKNGLDIDALETTLKVMLDLFIELEEYEKCSKIKDVIEQI
jgi:hypothetical protein